MLMVLRFWLRGCLEQEIGLVTFSSDLVFDGNHAAPVESDAVAPLNVWA